MTRGGKRWEGDKEEKKGVNTGKGRRDYQIKSSMREKRKEREAP